MARYMTRTPVALAKVFEQKDGRVKLLTPRDPKTGVDHRLFDPLDWVHSVTTQTPDAMQHLVRYQGAYANAARARYRPEVVEGSKVEPADEDRSVVGRIGAVGLEDEVSSFAMHRRRSWGRWCMNQVDPLVCPCGGELKIISVITDPVVVDRIGYSARGRMLVTQKRLFGSGTVLG